MPLDPKARDILDALKALGTPELAMLSVSEARKLAIERIDFYRCPLARVDSIQNRTIPGPSGEIPVRLYRPDSARLLPLLVFFHGGGWVIGNLETHDAVCRALSVAAQAVVVSVDYRLAPEHKFPTPSDDCLAATRWLAEHAAEFGADTNRVAVAGDSAGGNLAAVTALRIRDEGGPRLSGQILVYPVTGYYEPGTPSYMEFAEGFGLTRSSMIWFWNHYLQTREQASHPYASPLQARSHAGLPPALVIIAECDTLRDEGLRYALRLREARVETDVRHYQGMIHGFFSAVGVYAQANEAVKAAAEWVHAKFESRVASPR